MELEEKALKTLAQEPSITEPQDGSTLDFGEPITIKWDAGSLNLGDITRWRLCVGTTPTSKGKNEWDILVGDMSSNQNLSYGLNIQDLHAGTHGGGKVNEISIQLMYGVVLAGSGQSPSGEVLRKVAPIVVRHA